MKQLVSPIPWVGGKSRLRETIIARIPKHHTYAEVFAGAAWVFFGKEASKVEAINDLNGELVNLYQTIKHKTEEFYEALWYMFPSRQLHSMAKELLESPDRDKLLTDVERAVLFYYYIKNAFGARYGGAFGFSKVRPPKGVIGLDLLCDMRERLSRTFIENMDFERMITFYDTADTFFYCDPPYVVADGKGYYQFGFNEAEHERLRNTLANAKGKWLLSYDDTPEIRSLYKGFKIEKTEAIPYTLNNKGGKVKHKHELLISNY